MKFVLILLLPYTFASAQMKIATDPLAQIKASARSVPACRCKSTGIIYRVGDLKYDQPTPIGNSGKFIDTLFTYDKGKEPNCIAAESAYQTFTVSSEYYKMSGLFKQQTLADMNCEDWGTMFAPDRLIPTADLNLRRTSVLDSETHNTGIKSIEERYREAKARQPSNPAVNAFADIYESSTIATGTTKTTFIRGFDASSPWNKNAWVITVEAAYVWTIEIDQKTSQLVRKKQISMKPDVLGQMESFNVLTQEAVVRLYRGSAKKDSGRFRSWYQSLEESKDKEKNDGFFTDTDVDIVQVDASLIRPVLNLPGKK